MSCCQATLVREGDAHLLGAGHSSSTSEKQRPDGMPTFCLSVDSTPSRIDRPLPDLHGEEGAEPGVQDPSAEGIKPPPPSGCMSRPLLLALSCVGWLLAALFLGLLLAQLLGSPPAAGGAASSVPQATAAAPTATNDNDIDEPSSGAAGLPLPVERGGAGCRMARSRAEYGSGPAVCYQGFVDQGQAWERDGGRDTLLGTGIGEPPVGAGACASCGSTDAAADCLSCPPGFEVDVSGEGSPCSGRCVPTGQAASPQAAVAGCESAANSCAVWDAEEAPLCYDADINCPYDGTVCSDPAVPERCPATCGGCSPPDTDPALPGLLLGWKQHLKAGDASPVHWAWNPEAPLSVWPGVYLEAGDTNGGFLNSLDLSAFRVSGSLDPSWGYLYNPLSPMRWDLSRNQITGTIPDEWSAVVPGLSRLDLSHNRLSGPLPAAWSRGVLTPARHRTQLYAWMEVDFSFNRLTGTLPAELFSTGPLRSVAELNLGDNMLSGEIPAAWSAMHPDLRTLILRNNSLSGALPREFSVFQEMWRMGLANNRLTGTLPPEYSAMERLEGLDLERNLLTGPLPPSWAALSGAYAGNWNLAHNRLTGSLPSKWSRLTNLQRLELQGNRLTGTLPAWISAFEQLAELDLSGNQLSGTLPREISLCTRLRTLRLAGNKLQGSVPAGWSALSFLDTLDLGGNEGMRGAVPLPLGATVRHANTSLVWEGTDEEVWDRHGDRMAEVRYAVYNDSDIPDILVEYQCVYCRDLHTPQDKCACIQDCCASVDDSMMCLDDFSLTLGMDECDDPCAYCWTLPSVEHRSQCFHNCCADIDDDDNEHVGSRACYQHDHL
eukprot:jgi/Tetstr1/446603/TSEL_034127.t1